MSFVSGPYTWSYDGSPIGIVADAPNVRYQFGAEVVTGDDTGDAIKAIINRGGSMFVDLIFQEFDRAGAAKAFWPFSNSFGVMEAGVPGSSNTQIGCPMTGKSLLAQAVPGSCATPANWLARKAVLAPGFDIRFALGSRLRNVPMSFLIMPEILATGGSESSYGDLAAANVALTSLLSGADSVPEGTVYTTTIDGTEYVAYPGDTAYTASLGNPLAENSGSYLNYFIPYN